MATRWTILIWGPTTTKLSTPTEKVIISFHETREEALEAEIALHDFFDVAENLTLLTSENRPQLGLSAVLTPTQSEQRAVVKETPSLDANTKDGLGKTRMKLESGKELRR